MKVKEKAAKIGNKQNKNIGWTYPQTPTQFKRNYKHFKYM